MKPRARLAEAVLRQARQSADRRGFVLIIIVGMLAVLVVLGLSFAEQGRLDLIGAANSRDLAALDALAENGFQMALRTLHDDRNVLSAANGFSDASNWPGGEFNGGVGWTSRWGYNPKYLTADSTGVQTPAPAAGLGLTTSAAPNHDTDGDSRNARNFLDSWQMVFWNEETLGASVGAQAYGYNYQFDPGTSAMAKLSEWGQRLPQDPGKLVDVWPLQPFARVKKFRVQAGSVVGFVQVGVTPTDGGLNLNDMYLPGTVKEDPGWFETLSNASPIWMGSNNAPSAGAGVANMGRKDYASPDRRTFEYLLGRRPEHANRTYSWLQHVYRPGVAEAWASTTLSGNMRRDDGVYNFCAVPLPWGRDLWSGSTDTAGGDCDWSMLGKATLQNKWGHEPTVFYNASPSNPNRYNMEHPRYVMWVATYPFSMRYSAWNYFGSSNTNRSLVNYGRWNNYQWYSAGRSRVQTLLPTDTAARASSNHEELLFNGFGFDMMEPKRGGINGSVTGDQFYSWNGLGSGRLSQRWNFTGAGVGGHPKRKSFQLHMVPQVARGRFWTDLMAGWYFGGSPGFTSMLGVGTDSSGGNYNNWAHVGSSYDSLGIGTHWMPPSAHIWLPGKWGSGPGDTADKGRLHALETSSGLRRHPGNMPPTKAAATYAYPMRRWTDDEGMGCAHFTFTNQRLSIRAWGLQEAWGDPTDDTIDPSAAYPYSAAAPGTQKWYDAVNVNVTNFSVVYGLLHPEKIPSMLNRTTVAPHLHWKARMLDCELRLCNPNQDYDRKRNFYVPVMLGLKDPASPLPKDWDPETNPWVPLRLEAQQADQPWHPDRNPWVKPELVNNAQPYDPLKNPFKSEAWMSDGTRTSDLDYSLRPWFVSMKTPLRDPAAGFDSALAGNPIMQAQIVYDSTQAFAANTNPLLPIPIRNLDAGDNPGNGTDLPLLSASLKLSAPVFTVATTPDNTGVANDPDPPGYGYDRAKLYEPMMADFAGGQTANDNPSNPGWQGYRFEPRDYNTRTFDTADYDSSSATSSPVLASNGQAALDDTDDWSKNAGVYSYHRAVDPRRPWMLLGKMDYFTPEPDTYRCLNNAMSGFVDVPGSNDLADDVFPDCHYDQALSHPVTQGTTASTSGNGATTGSRMTARQTLITNWPDWFRQRYRQIPGPKDSALTQFKPQNNGMSGVLNWPEGRVPITRTISSEKVLALASTEPPYPHMLHGLPNPDYLLLYPGSVTSIHWADQFRRYLPVWSTAYVDYAGREPGAPPWRWKLIDEDDMTGQTAAEWRPVDPFIPVPKESSFLTKHTPFVPRIGKDDAWRLTRIGRKYQEIVADEILDYQINPWWPNPCQQLPVANLTDIGVPLSETALRQVGFGFHDMDARLPAGLDYNGAPDVNSPYWVSYGDHADGNIGKNVPHYLAYYNRFWVRAAHRYNRGFPGALDSADRMYGEPYREIAKAVPAADGVLPMNASESRGIYPQTFQYWGQYPPSKDNAANADFYKDRVMDFPFNTLEDAIGGDWRYTSEAVVAMDEPAMAVAPRRNHPYRTWADFVAMLGHLVYRSPIGRLQPDGSADTTNHPGYPNWVRDPILGVNAYTVCHGANADSRNQGQFFDGSKVATGANLGPDPSRDRSGTNAFGHHALADALMGFRPAVRGWDKAVVAIDGHWPISGNMGAWPKSMDDAGPVDPSGNALGLDDVNAFLYPTKPDPFTSSTDASWRYRIDMWRGRDAGGQRVEHHYISERAANDVLVSLSNGRIGPIDFDGDGYITMTRRKDNAANLSQRGDFTYEHARFPTTPANSYWLVPRGYPYHNRGGNHPSVKWEDARVANTNFDNMANMSFGVRKKPTNASWVAAPRDEVLNSSVTLPIKFRSNTFRVTVVVEMTDARYRDVLTTRRYSRVYSRLPGTPTGTQVHGSYTGEFVLHGGRTISADVDPHKNWLGASMGQ